MRSSEKKMTVKQWLAIREEAGRKIDPQTAEVHCSFVQLLDPYGVYPDLPKECHQVGRDCFARSPGSDIWVWFGDLPPATRAALWDSAERSDKDPQSARNSRR